MEIPLRQVAVHVVRSSEGMPGGLVSVFSRFPEADGKFRSSAIVLKLRQAQHRPSNNRFIAPHRANSAQRLVGEGPHPRASSIQRSPQRPPPKEGRTSKTRSWSKGGRTS